jgi:hypothetical protein
VNKKHGMKHTKTYSIWRSMRRRCNDPGNCGYPRYGARGIKVCERWDSSFVAFLADMGEAREDQSIDRIDNSRGYEPSNCRWATMKEQQRNRTNNLIIEHGGLSLCLIEWAERTGIGAEVISNRLASRWPVERALTQPIRAAQSMQARPLKSRVLVHLRELPSGSVEYYALARHLWPPELFPKAWGHSKEGGPCGWSLNLGRVLRGLSEAGLIVDCRSAGEPRRITITDTGRTDAPDELKSKLGYTRRSTTSAGVALSAVADCELEVSA